MSFLFIWSLRAGGVVLVALTLAAALRGRSAATRNLVLRIALAVAWLVPLASLVAPRFEVPMPAPTVAPAVPRLPPTFQTPTPITEGWSLVQPDPKDVATLSFERVTPFSTAWVPAVGPISLIWYAGMGFLVLRWLTGMVRLRRLRRTATPTDAPDVWRTAIAVPATYGRTILVPRESAEWPEARLRAAILHERAHVARRDWHWQTLAALFAAVNWANPLAWLLARALRDTAEAAADDAVLAQGVAPSAYARELLAVAASVGPTGPALAMARRGGVGDRVVAILSPKRDRRGPSRVMSGLVLLPLLAIGFAVAGVAQVHPTPESFAKTLPAGARVEIVSLADSVSAWSPTGKPLYGLKPVRDSDFDRRYVQKDEHGVDVTLRAGGVPGTSEPWIRLSGPGVRFSTALHDGKASIRWGVPKATATENLRVGVAAEPWTAYVGAPIPYRLSPLHMNGKADPAGTTIAFYFPRAFAESNVRVRLLDSAGRTLGSTITEPRVPLGRGAYRVTEIVGVGVARARVASVAFDTREYETVDF